MKTRGQVRVGVNDLGYGLPAGTPARPTRVTLSPFEFSDATVVSKYFKL